MEAFISKVEFSDLALIFIVFGYLVGAVSFSAVFSLAELYDFLRSRKKSKSFKSDEET